MNKRARNKRTVQRAQTVPQGGMILSPQQIQAMLALGNAKSKQPAGKYGDSIFTPGDPLATQAGVNPGGYPRQWNFQPSYNVSPIDRTLNNPDIPSFAQLRTLARMYSGVNLCERVWLDMVPKLKPKITLRQDLIDGGAKESDFQPEITALLKFFEKPDRRNDIHSWLRIALKEQTQIDELYMYKRRQRGGGLFALEVTAGDTMKPLLDLWGRVPQPPDAAYQQYPWNIPGEVFTTADMIHYSESPSADTPYGFSRVERIMIEVNQALRKKRQDLARYTRGNIPAGMMQVPEALNWSPEQLEMYESMWNALTAGNEEKQVQIKFAMPGMVYTPFDNNPIDPAFDRFLLNHATAAYGVGMSDISFTEDIHKSNDDGQQNMLYRRTLYPIVSVYAFLLTRVIHEDFHDDRFIFGFSGFEEAEDIETQANAYSTLANVGAIAPSDIARILKLPEVPKTGPFILGKTGPIFLKDYAEGSQLRTANVQSQIASMQLAANPQQDGTDEEDGEQETGSKQSKGQTGGKQGATSRVAEALDGIDEIRAILRARNVTLYGVDDDGEPMSEDIEVPANGETAHSTHAYKAIGGEPYYVARAQQDTEELPQRTGDSKTARTADQPDATTRAAGVSEVSDSGTRSDVSADAKGDYRRWKERAIADVRVGRPQRGFTSEYIPAQVHAQISTGLRLASTPDEVRAVFGNARESGTSFLVEAASSSGGNPQPNKSNWRLRW